MSQVSFIRPSSRPLRWLAALCASVLLLSPASGLLPASVAQAADAPAVNVKVNFQPTATAVPAGFTKDVGEAFSDTTGMGWIRQDSLTTTHVPFGVPLNTRDRSACTALTAQQRSFIHMQAPVTNTTNNATPVAWEYAVPNGSYQVSVGVGDANTGADAENHTVNVEGVAAVKNFPRSTAASCVASRLTTGTVSVDVTDGKLTVDALTGTNTKLQYVTIDTAPTVTGLTATPGSTDIALDWADSTGATSYKVFRGSNLPVATTGTATPVATTTASEYVDAAATKGTVYYYAVIAVSGTISSPAVVTGAMVDDATPTLATMPVKVDFVDAAGALAPGYTRDFGQNFANVRGYGWVVPGTGTPINLVGNGRTRGNTDVPDPRLLSMMHMQANNVSGTFNGIAQPGSWQLAVADGSYDVELAVGDATPGADPTSHEINVEGVKAVDDFAVTATTTGAARFKTATLTAVQVTDGLLTVDAVGGTNTKITYITVTPTPADAAPAAPTALTAAPGDGAIVLDWADNAEADIEGYLVFRGTGATVDVTGTPLSGSTPLTESTFTDSTAVNGTTYRYVVVAVDQADQRSSASSAAVATPDAAAATPASLPFNVQFQDQAGTDPASGYDKDYGQAFTNTRGRGWVAPGTTTPRSMVGNGRTRPVRTGVDVAERQRKLIHMQGNQLPTPIAGPGAYEVALADGRYDVTVSVGDQPGNGSTACPAPCYDSRHSVTVEGTQAINAFQGTAAKEFQVTTVTVTVTDGRLTLDPTGGTNTKINFVEVEASDITAPAAPQGVTAAPGENTVTVEWAANDETDLAGYHVYRATSAPVALTPANRLTATPQAGRSYTDATAVNGTAYTYVVTAIDEAGNESDASSAAAATPADTTAPAVPAGLVATGGVEKVSLRWTPVVTADLKEYRVYRSTTSPVAPGADQLVATVAKDDGAVFEDTGRVNGTELFYAITSVDLVGNESAPSTEASATPTAAPDVTAPATPAGVTAVAGDARVTVSWTANTEGDLSGYHVYRSAVSGTDRTRLTTTPLGADVTTYLDTAVTNAATYYYVVEAVDLTGNASSQSAEVNATPRDTTPPAVPSGVTATAGVHSVTVRWNANTESDLRGYRIYRATTTTVLPTEDNLVGVVLASSGRAFLDSDRDENVTYSYVVTAEDRLRNESLPSTVKSATPLPAPDTTAPAVPGGLTAEVSGSTVTLAWNAVTATDLAGYNVYRSTSAGSTDRVKITNTPLTARTFVDSGAPAGATAYYVVTAVDTSNNESAASSEASAVLPSGGTDVKFVFTTAAAPALAGWTKDTGAAFTTARGYGWVTEASLASATHTPIDFTLNARLRTRTAPVTDLQNRTIHMRYGDIVPTPSATTGNLTPGAWEYGLPNGRYTVTVSVGDQPGAAKTGCAAPCYDSVHGVRVEGSAAVTAFQPAAAAEYKTGVVTVDVTDGKLTVDAVGSSNTKLNYVTIVSSGPVEPDTTPPGAPQGFTAVAGNASVSLSWTAGSGDDIAGYYVYRSLSDQVSPAPASRITASPVAATAYTDSGLTNGTTYYYLVTAIDQAGNESLTSAVRSATPVAGAVTLVDTKVNFQDATTTPPTGYLGDWGQAFGSRTAAGQGTGQTYGWIGESSLAPISIVGNGRNRNTGTPPANQPDQRLATFMHMQLPATVTTGVRANAAWEMAVPNGAYLVTVAVGDAGTAVDSTNWVNIENQNAIAAHIPTADAKFATATRTVVVSDGRLTLNALGGTNTKIAYVDISGFDSAGRPYPTVVQPANGASSVVTNVSVTTDNRLNADNGAVDGATLAGGNVKLTKVADGTAVAGTGATSGGGDTVTFQAAAPLEASTLYRFEVTTGAKDRSGRAFLPFSSVFTTGTTGGGTNPGPSTAAFDKALAASSGASLGKSYTSLVIGPDGKLYAGSVYGQIYRWTINADGTLSNEQVINTVRTHATAQGWEGAPNRTIIGMAFDPASTPTNPILWITDNQAYLGQDVPNFTGAISRLSGANLENYQEVVVNLPRSIKDHETNSLAFKNGKIYVVQGSMNAMGAPEGTWKKPEQLLSAAMLELDPAKLPSQLPLDVATPEMSVPARGGVPAHVGTYDPYAPDAALTLYATGLRNGYDLVFHSNGRLYSGVNGSAAGGNTPATPATYPASCAKRADGGYTGPGAPAITGNPQAETDYIFDVKKGKYYGHPNPVRCEYVLNAGNPTGYTGNPLFKVNAYPAGQLADPNYDLAGVYDAGMHASANGAIEYKNTSAFGGSFAGKLVVVRYSSNQEIVSFDIAANGAVSAARTGITGFTGFRQPLDVTEDVTKGNLYVSELTNNPATTGIVLLRPQGGTGPAVGTAEVTERLVYTDTQNGAPSAAKNVAVKNVGGGTLAVNTAAITGANANQFALGAGAPTFPATVAPGATLNIPVVFNPTSTGPKGAALSLTTSDPQAQTASSTLRGLGVLGTGGSNEPSLQWILDTLQIPVNVGDPDPTNNDMPAGSALLGDEVDIKSFTKMEFDQVVEVEMISLFGPGGPTANPNVVTVAAHSTANPATRTPLLRGPNGSNQTVLPAATVVGEYDLETPFGFDFTWHGLGDRVAYSEDALNTWDPTNKRKVRVYPLKNTDGTVVADSYIIAPEDVLTPVDFQDAVLIVRNVKPAVTSGAGRPVASPTELVFSGVKGSTSAPQDVVVTNTGTTPLVVTSVTTVGDNPGSFAVTGGAQTIGAGLTGTLQVRFTPSGTTVGTQKAVLRIASDSGTQPVLDVGLYGLATNGEQGNNEPPLKAVVDTLGHPIDVGGNGLIIGTGAEPIGDEVTAPLFTRVDATKPVGMKAVARYSPDETLPFGWYTAGTGEPATTTVATIALDNEQTLNPAIIAGGATSFTPGTEPFGFFVDSNSFNRKSYTQDGLNTGPTNRAVRTYPAKNRAGAVIPNTYLVTFEDAANGDYQDYVFLVTNVSPAGGTAPVARIDFAPTGTVPASGYTLDNGAAFSAATGRGWVSSGTTTPLDMTTLTRDRTTATTVDARQRTLILMQGSATQAPSGPGAFEYVVPNGNYTVTVSVGDPGFVDSTHRIQVEGVTAVAGFAGTVADPSRTATVTVPVADGRLTIDAIGGTNTKLQYVDIDRVGTVVDTTAPTATLTVSGLQQSAGVYKNAATLTVTATDSGSGVSGRSYSVNGAAFVAYTAPVELTTPGSYSVRARAVDVAGNTTTSAATAFTIVVAGPSKANIAIENVDGVPFADRLVMNRIQNPETGTRCRDTANCDPVTGPFFAANVVHDVSTLRIRNTGSEALNVTGLGFTGPFALATPQALPVSVAVGASLDIPVRFTATTIGTAGGLWTGTLTVTSDDVDQPSIPVELAGFWQSISEGNQEPDVAEITRLFGYTTAITTPGVPINQQGALNATGDEVLSPFWLRANAGLPVAVRQLAAYHTQGNTATIAWYPKATGGNGTTIVTHDGDEGQSIFPHRNGSTTVPAGGTFAPTTPFGLRIDSEFSDESRNNSAVDITNGCVAPCGHHMRFWPARDRTGAIIPNTYLVGMDYSGINYDFNDNVYLVSNIKPEFSADPSASAPQVGAPSLQLGFSAAAGGRQDKDGQGTGFGTTQPNKLDRTVGANSYAPSLLDLDTTGTGTLKVTTSGSLAGVTPQTGSNAGTDNTLVNGLRTAFDGSGDPFTVTGRILGPLDAINAGSEQAGIQFGPDQDNFVKIAVINQAGVTSLQLYSEQSSTGTVIGTTVPVPSPATIASLDLALVANPAARTVRAAYRANDGTWVFLPTALTLPTTNAGRFFDTQAKAGLIASHKAGAPFTAVYDSFGIVAGDVTAAPTMRQALFRLDVAGAGNYTDSNGQVWTPDTGRFTPATAISEGAAVNPQEIAGTTDDVLYRTYRGNVNTVTQSARVLSYALPTSINTTVDLRLHFAERAAGNDLAGERLFDIEAEGKVIRRDVDIVALAGGQNIALVLGLNNVAVTDGTLNLTFRASVDYPSIAAIEVLCQGACLVDTTAPAAPSGLTAAPSGAAVALNWNDNVEADVVGYHVYRSVTGGAFTRVTATPVAVSGYTDATAPASTAVSYRVTAVDSSENESAASSTVSITTPAPVATSIRINAGGAAQNVGGTTWSACTSLTACSGWVAGAGAFSAGTPAINGPVAPANAAIYQTEWTGGQAGGLAPGSTAFTYDVTVPNGSYLLRLHFAENNKTAVGQRQFDVNVEGARKLSGFDIFAEAGGINRAIVREFPVTVSDGKMTVAFLTGIENAKVSGLEILSTGTADTSAPAAPSALTATGSAANVALDWADSTATDLAGYAVFRSTSETGTFTRITPALLTASAYTDTTAPTGVASFYRVVTVDRAGNASAPATASATRGTVVDTTAPAVVTGVTATTAASGITVGWSASAATDLAGYNVYRASSATGTYTKVNSTLVTGTSFADTSAPVGAASFYQVTAVDNAATPNESVRSATVSATRPAAAQQAVRINTGGGAVTTGGNSYLADQFFTGGKTYSNSRVTAIAGTTDDALYVNERSATTDGGSFGYSVPVANGTYQVVLHFAELYWGATGGGAGGTGRRVFSANIEGGTVEVANLDLNANSAPMTAQMRTFTTTVTDGKLDLDFTSQVNQASIGAFEILPQ